MRAIYLIVLLTVCFHSSGQTNSPFLHLKFDKVVFYDIEEASESGTLIVDNNGKPVQTILRQVELDSATIKSLNLKLGQKKSFGNVTAFCFDPHCGFVYFLKGRPVGQVTICLDCNRLYSTIDIPAQKQGKQGEGDNVYYIAEGLSKSFRLFINGLLKKNKFKHQIQPGSAFDE